MTSVRAIAPIKKIIGSANTRNISSILPYDVNVFGAGDGTLKNDALLPFLLLVAMMMG